MKYLVFLFLLLPAAALSQNVFYDVVYLKGGGYIKGSIIKWTPGEELEMVDLKGKEYNLSFSEIDRMEKEDFDKYQFLNVRKQYTDTEALKKSFYILLKGGLNRSFKDEATFASVSLAGGMKLGGLGIGGGIGYEQYNKFEKEAFIPLVLDARYMFAYTQVKPYMFLNAGYSFPVDKKKGFLIKAGAGTAFKIAGPVSGLFELSYYWQEYRYDVQNFTAVGNVDFFSINTGVLF